MRTDSPNLVGLRNATTFGRLTGNVHCARVRKLKRVSRILGTSLSIRSPSSFVSGIWPEGTGNGWYSRALGIDPALQSSRAAPARFARRQSVIRPSTMKILQSQREWHPFESASRQSAVERKIPDRVLKWLFFLQAAVRWFLVLIFMLAIGGCVQTKMTEPARSAVEQLLLRTATDQNLKQAYIHSDHPHGHS